MSDNKNRDFVHQTPSGATVSVYTSKQAVADHCFKHYDNGEHLNMNCPFCGEDLWGNSLDGERDGGEYWDSYTCDTCDLIVTLITPARYTEYWQVPAGKEKYLIEFMSLGEPSTWGDENDA